MKNIAVTLTALTIFSAPSLADAIHTDGPSKPFVAATNLDAIQDFGATITPARAKSGKKTNFSGGHVFKPHDLRR